MMVKVMVQLHPTSTTSPTPSLSLSPPCSSLRVLCGAWLCVHMYACVLCGVHVCVMCVVCACGVVYLSCVYVCVWCQECHLARGKHLIVEWQDIY
eukprot:m.87083 g.87083  ORF g.87083 m.87083 type:complete len:95 (+) comp26035_c0_seq2:1074-1358(+)